MTHSIEINDTSMLAIHWPLKLKDPYSILTPRRVFNYTRCYRVLYGPQDVPDDEFDDVLVPITRTTRRQGSITRLRCLVFYEGAEEDLDRYLRWIVKGTVVNDYGVADKVYVARSDTYTFQQSLDSDFEACVRFVAPGDLNNLDLLTTSSDSGMLMF